MHYNFCLNTDSYKASHYLQYPPNTTHLSAYIESRGGEYENALFFGLQIFLKEYLSRPITQQNIDEAESVLTAHGLPFNRAGWQYILDRHQGFLPLRIEAIPEGMVLPIRHCMVQVINTDPACYWLTTYIETALLRAVWYPTTVATRSWYCRQIIKEYLDKTADSCATLPFKMHDFGSRGASSLETAAIGGLAHLVNFQGTDTIYGLIAARDYYHEPMAGVSMPAAEHSTIITWGREHEVDAYANMLDQFSGPNKMVAVVSDSYNIFEAVEHLWGTQLKERVMSSGGTIIIRPDSGNPVKVVCKTLEILMEKFSYTVNSKGYRLLPPYLRLIQGDGISYATIKAILAEMAANKLSADNVAFGIGAELLQKLNRDTMEFAMKVSAVNINGVWHEVFKDPITGLEKRSKKGRLALIKTGNVYQTIKLSELGSATNLLQPVFENGKILLNWDLTTIRNRANNMLA